MAGFSSAARARTSSAIVGIGLRGGEVDVQGAEAAHEGVRDALGRDPRGEAQVTQAGEQLLEHHADLETRQRGTQTEVRAETERDVWVGLAAHVEALRRVEHRLV